MGINNIINLFKNHSVSVSGTKGSGKDVLFGNVISRIKKPYISNVDYTCDDLFQGFDINKLDCGKNSYFNFLEGNIKYYSFPYINGSDLYISDCGIYFPAQYNNELNRNYPYFPVFMALSRQVGDCKVHTNSQELSRVWDKLREQSDMYIRCSWCFVFLGFVFQKVIVYDKYDSALNRVRPCRVRRNSLFNANANIQADIYRDDFYNKHGLVEKHFLFYRNLSKHDTYDFKFKLKDGV